MEKSISNISIYPNNSDSSRYSDTESFSLENELTRKRNCEYQNLQQFEMISSSITNQYNRVINKEETIETDSEYFSAPQKLQFEHSKHKAGKLKYLKEELEMRKTVRGLEKKLNCILLRNKIISDEVLSLRKKKDVTAKALCIAKKYYSSVWGINVNIENPLDDRFTSIVNFGFAGNLYPLKFLIDRNNRDVLDWDGSSLLLADEEREIKERFSGVKNYFPQVLSELRLIALNKINLS